MSDTATDTTEQTEAPAEQKAPKVTELKDCLCSRYELVGKKEDGELDNEDVYNTGCEQKTKRTFAQGHDARLVSFLVGGHYDGYVLRHVANGVSRTFATPAEAAALASDSLRDKAASATKNKQAKREAAEKTKAEREAKKVEAAAAKEKAKAEKAAKAEADKAAKAAAPKDDKAKVVAGSGEGQAAAAPGKAKIKVGRYEYDADIDENGQATFVDGKGQEQTVERDGYRLLG